MGATDSPENYYRESLRQSGGDDLDARLSSSMQGRIHLAMYLGLWDGHGSLPSRFEEDNLEAVDERLDGLVLCAKKRLRFEGIDGIEPWLPLLRFLSSIATDQAFDDARGSHPYSKELRRRYRGYLEDILTAAIPELPKKERRVPPKLFEEFIDIYSRLLEIRRRVRARAQKPISETDWGSLTAEERATALEYRCRIRERAQAIFPESDFRLLFPELPADVIKALSEDDQSYRHKHDRGLGQEKIAVCILAYHHKASEATIRAWLGKARDRDQRAVSWGHVEPLRRRLGRRAKIYRADP